MEGAPNPDVASRMAARHAAMVERMRQRKSDDVMGGTNLAPGGVPASASTNSQGNDGNSGDKSKLKKKAPPPLPAAPPPERRRSFLTGLGGTVDAASQPAADTVNAPLPPADEPSGASSSKAVSEASGAAVLVDTSAPPPPLPLAPSETWPNQSEVVEARATSMATDAAALEPVPEPTAAVAAPHAGDKAADATTEEVSAKTNAKFEPEDEVSAASAPTATSSPAAEAPPEWYEGWDDTHGVFYYFHAASQQSMWEKPNAPFVPYSPDDDGDDDGDDDDSGSESVDNGRNDDGVGGSDKIETKLNVNSMVAGVGEAQAAGSAPVPSMAWIPSAVDERQCRALLGELMYNEDEVGVIFLT